MRIEPFKWGKAGLGRFLALAALLVLGVSAFNQRIVTTEQELHSALWDASVTDILLVADVRVHDSQLWSQQGSVLAPASPSPSPPLWPPPSPLWAPQPSLPSKPVPIARHLLIRSSSSATSSPGPSPPAASPAAAALHLQLPLLDLTQAQGWLQLQHNSSLRLQGLQLASTLHEAQPGLQPFESLLRALITSPVAGAVSEQSLQQAGLLQLVAVSLEGCVERTDIGLPQSLAEAATGALPQLPLAVAAAASEPTGAVGAWSAASLSPNAPSARAVSQQLCLTSSNCSSSSSSGSSWVACGCLHGAVRVESAATALALSSSSPSSVDISSGVANTGTAATPPSPPPTPQSPVLVLLVSGSYSVSQVQVEAACLAAGSSQRTLQECVELAVAQLVLQEQGSAAEEEGSGSEAAAAVGMEGSRQKDFVVVLAVLLPVCSVLLAALLAVMCLLRRLRRAHLRERGAQRAPGVGPSTTLLITDIANSTALWESLPEEVMDQALKLHHSCLRVLLARHDGYESATEGDSFILAFHQPAHAAKFALSAQVQLMEVKWPAEVLAHADGHEVWVMPRATELQPAPSSSLGATSVINAPLNQHGLLDPSCGGGGAGGGPRTSFGILGGRDYGGSRMSWSSRARSFKAWPNPILWGPADRPAEFDPYSAPLEFEGGAFGSGHNVHRSSSRVRQFLRGGAFGGSPGRADASRPSSMQGYSEAARLAIAGIRRRVGAAMNGGSSGQDLEDPHRANSFAVGFLGSTKERKMLFSQAVSTEVTAGGGGLPYTVPNGAAVAATAGPARVGSFTSGTRSLLRQALSFNRRQGSFKGVSRTGLSAGPAASGSAADAATDGASAGDGGAGGGGSTGPVGASAINTAGSGTTTSSVWAISPGQSRGGSRRTTASHHPTARGSFEDMYGMPGLAGSPSPHPALALEGQPAASRPASTASVAAAGGGVCGGYGGGRGSLLRSIGRSAGGGGGGSPLALSQAPYGSGDHSPDPDLQPSPCYAPEGSGGGAGDRGIGADTAAAAGAAAAMDQSGICSVAGISLQPVDSDATTGILLTSIIEADSSAATDDVRLLSNISTQLMEALDCMAHSSANMTLAATRAPATVPAVTAPAGEEQSSSVPPRTLLSMTPSQRDRLRRASAPGDAPGSSPDGAPPPPGATMPRPAAAPRGASGCGSGRGGREERLGVSIFTRARGSGAGGSPLSAASGGGLVPALAAAAGRLTAGQLGDRRCSVEERDSDGNNMRSGSCCNPASDSCNGNLSDSLPLSPRVSQVASGGAFGHVTAAAAVAGGGVHVPSAAAAITPSAATEAASEADPGRRAPAAASTHAACARSMAHSSALAGSSSALDLYPAHASAAASMSHACAGGSPLLSPCDSSRPGAQPLLGGSALSAAMARLMRAPRRSLRDFPYHSSASLPAMDGHTMDGAGGRSSMDACFAGCADIPACGACSPRLGGLAPILEPRSQPLSSPSNEYPDISIRGVGGAGGTIAAAAAAAAAAKNSASGGSQEFQAPISIGHLRQHSAGLPTPTCTAEQNAIAAGGGSGGGGGGMEPAVAGGGSGSASPFLTTANWPPIERSSSVSQMLVRGLSRASLAVRQLTKDRNMGNNSSSNNNRYTASGGGGDSWSLVSGSGRGGGGGSVRRGQGNGGASSSAGMSLAAAAALATASDCDRESGVELSAIGMVTDGLMRSMALGRPPSLLQAPVLSGPEGGGGGSQSPLLDLGITVAPDDASASPCVSALPSRAASKLAAVATSARQFSRTSPPNLFGMGGGGATAVAGAGGSAPSPLPPGSGSGGAFLRLSFLSPTLAQRGRAAERTSTSDWSQSVRTSLVAVQCLSWRERCREEWPLAVRPAPPARCAYRGLRVRMGLHTGISTASDVTFNHTTSHMAYGGVALKVAKAVADAAAGGMVLMSHSTFQALQGGSMAELPGSPQAVFSGESDLGLSLAPEHPRYCLYQLVHRDLLQRLGYAAPLRNIPLSQMGTEDAPTGYCAISFMHVASASMLVAELGQPGVEALQQFKSIVTELCSRCGGYLVEASEGLCLAAFRHAAAALVWALSCREALEQHNWSAEVRRWYRFTSPNPGGPKPVTGGPNTGGGAPHTNPTPRNGRGPRPRTGVHVGSVNVEVNQATGRMTYRGKVMNRTSRIAHKAASEQIVCSKEAWEAVGASIATIVREIEEERQRAAAEAAEAAEAAAAAAAAEGTSSSAAEGEDVLPELGGAGGAALTLASGGSGRGSTRALSLLRGRGAGAGGSSGGGVGSGGASPVRREALSEVQPKLRPGSLAANLAATLRSTRSVSAKQMSATALALSRRVTSFTSKHGGLGDTGGGGAGEGGGGAVGSGSGCAGAAASGLVTRAASISVLPRTALHNVVAAAAAAAQSFTLRRNSGPAIAQGMGPIAAAAAAATFSRSPAGAGNAPAGTPQTDGGGGGGDGAVPEESAPVLASSLEWQALRRLVGSQVQLPASKRLDARFLGSYSLKGVREEMRLFEVFWADERDEAREPAGAAAAGGSGTDAGTDGGGGTAAASHPAAAPSNPAASTEPPAAATATAAAGLSGSNPRIALRDHHHRSPQISVVSASRMAVAASAATGAAGASTAHGSMAAGVGVGSTGGRLSADTRAPLGPDSGAIGGRSGRSDWGAPDTGYSLCEEDLSCGTLAALPDPEPGGGLQGFGGMLLGGRKQLSPASSRLAFTEQRNSQPALLAASPVRAADSRFASMSAGMAATSYSPELAPAGGGNAGGGGQRQSYGPGPACLLPGPGSGGSGMGGGGSSPRDQTGLPRAWGGSTGTTGGSSAGVALPLAGGSSRGMNILASQMSCAGSAGAGSTRRRLMGGVTFAEPTANNSRTAGNARSFDSSSSTAYAGGTGMSYKQRWQQYGGVGGSVSPGLGGGGEDGSGGGEPAAGPGGPSRPSRAEALPATASAPLRPITLAHQPPGVQQPLQQQQRMQAPAGNQQALGSQQPPLGFSLAAALRSSLGATADAAAASAAADAGGSSSSAAAAAAASPQRLLHGPPQQQQLVCSEGDGVESPPLRSEAEIQIEMVEAGRE
ncbi:hypothetical protein Agub_g12220 [Astrephomene gubernaculifera]|uniref:Guanylate cyclase domain-containing protein n=1 Tax=Astrephomene gubernaculifera TaxID=47775 RepID=A0AAD3HRB6_9CHLO|nr:hypothetical protein Agub_g12220 [Astrephomene gubernaculifera]